MKERSLSDFWRDQADDPVLELISVLQGSRNLVGLMGSDLRVRWSGSGGSYTSFQDQTVSLDYAPLAECEAPFPGGAVDEVIGYAAHEGGHCIFSKPGKDLLITGEVQQRWRTLSPRFRAAWSDGRNHPLPDGEGGVINPVLVELCHIQNILEDAYVDTHVGRRWEVLGEHIKVSRSRMKEKSKATGQAPDLAGIARQAQPSRAEMTGLWVNISLYGEPRPRRCTQRVRRALDFLLEQTDLAIQQDNAIERQRMAVDVGNYLFRYFPEQAPPKAQGTGDGQPEQSGQAAQGSPDGSSQGTGGGDEEADDQEPQDGSGQDDDQGTGQNEPEAGSPTPADDRAEIIRRLKKVLERAAKEAQQDQDQADDAGDSNSGSGQTDGASVPTDQDDSGAGDAPGLPEDPDGFDGRATMDVPEEILEAIAEALELELEDLSQEVAEILHEDPRRVAAQAKKARYDQAKAHKAASQVRRQVNEVQRVFDQQTQAASRYLKGLPHGKVNSRQLARVGAGNLNAFQRKQVLGKPDMDVGLLLDVSGSMHRFHQVVDETAAVFAEALSRKQGVNFAAWAYTGDDAEVQLTRLCDRSMGKLHLADVDRNGGTPSGAAIAGVKVLMDRMHSQVQLLIHFTDGEPDSGGHVVRAVDECRKAEIETQCIAVKGPRVTAASLDYQYGRGNWQLINSVSDLPKAVMEILKKLD